MIDKDDKAILMGKDAQDILYPGVKPLNEMDPSELSEMEWMEKIKGTHKSAFRAAFDTLAILWPPEDEAGYWKMVTDRMSLIFNDNKGNELAKAFLVTLTEYLEKVGKERKKRYGESSNYIDAGMDGR